MVTIVITLEEKKQKEANVFPIGKRTMEERDNKSALGPTKKKGKIKEGDDAKAKKKSRPRRHFQVSNFLIVGDGQWRD